MVARFRAVAFALAAVGLAIMGATAGEIVLAHTSSGTSSSLPPTHSTTFPQHASGNFSIKEPLPSSGGAPLALGAKDTVSILFEFRVANYSLVDQGLSVRIPGTNALFATRSKPLTLGAGAETYTVTNASWQGPYNYTPYDSPGYTQLGYNQSNDNSTFTSNLLAVMTGLPWNTTQLVFRWMWSVTLASSDETIRPGTWADMPTQTLVPDQIVNKTLTRFQMLPAGQPLEVCLTGDNLWGRTFSMHAVVPVPYDDFVQVNYTVPLTAELPACWNLPPVGNLTSVGSFLIIHIWDFQGVNTTHLVTLLLFSFNVTVVPPAAVSGPPNVLGVSVGTLAAYVSLFAVASALLLAAVVVDRRGRVPPGSP